MTFALVFLLKFIGIAILAAILFYITGYTFLTLFVKKDFTSKPFLHLFLSFFSGLFICISFYAFFKTHGLTLNIGFTILLATLWIYSPKDFNLSLKRPVLWHAISPSVMLFVFVNLILLVSFASLFVLKPGIFPFASPFYDNIAYADIAEALKNTGHESPYNRFIIFNAIFEGTSIYHFTELWLAAMLSAFTGSSSLLALLIITYPLLQLVSLIGIAAMMEFFGINKILVYYLAFILLFAGTVIPEYYFNFPLLKANFVTDSFPFAFNGLKLASIYPVLILSFILFLKNRYFQAFVVYWSLVIIYPTTLIAVAGGSFAVIGLLMLFKKFSPVRITYLQLIFMGLSLSFFLAFVVSFNMLTGSKADVRSLDGSSGVFSFLSLHLPLKTYIILFAEACIKMIIYYFPFFVIIIPAYVIMRKHPLMKPVQYYIGLILLSSLPAVLFSILNHPKMNYWQAFYNFFFPAMAVLIITFFIFLWHTRTHFKLRSILISVFIFICLFQFYSSTRSKLAFKSNNLKSLMDKQDYDATYMKTCFDLFENEDVPKRIVGFSGTQDLFAGHMTVQSPFLSFAKQYNIPLDLSPFYVNYDSLTLTSTVGDLLAANPFHHYIKAKKEKGIFTSVENEMFLFVQKHNFLKFLIVAKNAQIYQPLQDLFELCETDPVSGERFYKRK